MMMMMMMMMMMTRDWLAGTRSHLAYQYILPSGLTTSVLVSS